VPLRYLFADRQANSRAGILRLGMQPLENYEDALVVLRRDSDAVVPHSDLPQRSIPLRENVDFRNARASEFDGVRHQVLKQLAQLAFIRQHDG
jgi:hypothetical protein